MSEYVNREAPTAESIAAAKPQHMGATTPPVQLRPEDVDRMTPEQIDAAFERLELHLILGGSVDDEGWPTDGKGRRLNPPKA